MSIALRPIGQADLPFLRQVYASTREEELALVDWTMEQKAAFIDMQFRAQHQYYQEHLQASAFDVILLDDQPIGRLYVGRWPDEIRVIDIALLPAYRNQGIGRTFLETLQAEAATTGKKVTIHVEKYNPALRLYQRLGFTPVADEGVYWFMEWRPMTQPTHEGAGE